MPQILTRPDGTKLVYEQVIAQKNTTKTTANPTLIFCGGFASDMQGSKALAVCNYAQQNGLGAIRFDYFAHGGSVGDFADGSIGRWLDDTLAIIDEVCQGPFILIGSSMGGWIATLAARARPERLAGLLLLAAAPDFTRRLMWAQMPPEMQTTLMEQGFVEQPNDYSDEPYKIYKKLIVEADAHMVLDQEIAISCPVRLIHGMKDTDVPWQLAHELIDLTTSTDVEMTLVKEGDHRLSTDADLARLRKTLGELVTLA
ncbi:MAG: alpha/beta hydrolase [Alphaproteobacteria bacterium]